MFAMYLYYKYAIKFLNEFTSLKMYERYIYNSYLLLYLLVKPLENMLVGR